MLNKDYKDMLSALCQEDVEFLLVGAYAMAAHGHLRATMDIDIWVRPTLDNARKLMLALARFGAPMDGVALDEFVMKEQVLQIGVVPRRIDILTFASGLDFSEALANSMETAVDGLKIHVLSIADLVQNKRATGRLQDLADVEALEKLNS